MRPPPPIRFPLVVLGGWMLLRGAMLIPGWPSAPLAPPPPLRTPVAVALADARNEAVLAARRGPPPTRKLVHGRRARAAVLLASAGAGPPAVHSPGPGAPSLAPELAGVPAPRPRDRASRWSLSAWVFIRPGEGASLAPAGTLGGSQIGARATYRLKPGLAASVRLYAPLANARAAEAALGLDWKPLRRLPVRLLAERRQALGPEGRSAFSLMGYGGVDAVPIGPLRLDAYGEAGVVGTRRRDFFADGAGRLTAPAGRLRVGAGVWGAAQPGASRLDAGPHAELRLGPAALSADWRFRLAGRARPGSGPTLTLSTGF